MRTVPAGMQGGRVAGTSGRHPWGTSSLPKATVQLKHSCLLTPVSGLQSPSSVPLPWLGLAKPFSSYQETRNSSGPSRAQTPPMVPCLPSHAQNPEFKVVSSVCLSSSTLFAVLLCWACSRMSFPEFIFRGHIIPLCDPSPPVLLPSLQACLLVCCCCCLPSAGERGYALAHWASAVPLSHIPIWFSSSD